MAKINIKIYAEITVIEGSDQLAKEVEITAAAWRERLEFSLDQELSKLKSENPDLRIEYKEDDEGEEWKE